MALPFTTIQIYIYVQDDVDFGLLTRLSMNLEVHINIIMACFLGIKHVHRYLLRLQREDEEHIVPSRREEGRRSETERASQSVESMGQTCIANMKKGGDTIE